MNVIRHDHICMKLIRDFAVMPQDVLHQHRPSIMAKESAARANSWDAPQTQKKRLRSFSHGAAHVIKGKSCLSRLPSRNGQIIQVDIGCAACPESIDL